MKRIIENAEIEESVEQVGNKLVFSLNINGNLSPELRNDLESIWRASIRNACEFMGVENEKD